MRASLFAAAFLYGVKELQVVVACLSLQFLCNQLKFSPRLIHRQTAVTRLAPTDQHRVYWSTATNGQMMVHVIHDMSVMMTTDKYYYTALNVITSAIARSILLTHTYGRAPLRPIYSVHPIAAASRY